MQKRMLLLFVLLSPSVACAMEDKFSNFFSSLLSYIPSRLKNSEVPLSPMQEVQKSKNDFEKQLIRIETESIDIGIMGPKISVIRHPIKIVDGLFCERAIDANPVEFLNYCYNQSIHKKCKDAININNLNASLLEICKEVRINGYSALGAAFIAKDVPLLYKCRFTQLLQTKGFKFTEKDETLMPLKLYNIIPELYRRTMILLLQDHQKGKLVVLPHDVRGYIVNYMMCLHKEEQRHYLLFR